jgi:hypothetical protein
LFYLNVFQAYRSATGATNLAEAGNSRYCSNTKLTKLPISQATQAMYKVNDNIGGFNFSIIDKPQIVHMVQKNCKTCLKFLILN